MTVGIGIIGAGMVGQMCHLANFVANPGCRVVALADLERAARLLAEFCAAVPPGADWTP